MAEEEARRRGCHSVHLDTLSFQALPFYQKHGYAVFGALENHPVGHTRYFLKKKLDQSPDQVIGLGTDESGMISESS